jgi:hypothetical protein
MESILTSIKKLLGITEEYEHFDPDIIMHINTVLVTLNQLGVGPEEGFNITSNAETWYDYLGDNMMIQGNVITFIYLSVKLLFDPPLSSAVLAAQERSIRELEWRIKVMAESLAETEETRSGDKQNAGGD